MDYHIKGDKVTVDTRDLGQSDWTDCYLDGKGDNVTVTYGNIIVGAGDATITATDPWSSASFWFNPVYGININLQTGVGTSSQGGTVHLIGVHQIHGSYLNDTVIGGAGDTLFWGNGGQDYFQGGSGISTYGVPGLISDYVIKVSLDGARATITGTGIGNSSTGVATLVNVQRISVWNPATATSTGYDITSFITNQDKALAALLPPTPARWNSGHALGSAVTVTYSFSANGLSSNAQAAVSSLLNETSSAVGIDFVKVATGGQINFNATAQTTGLGTVVGSPSGSNGHCEVTLNSALLADTSPGSPGCEALLHEIGAALGLKDANAPAGANAGATVMPAGDDYTFNTVMSYRQFDAMGGCRDNWGRLDLLALQYLYSARSSHTGNDIYTLGNATGLSLHTIVDGGGSNTVDASACTFGVTLNLNPNTLSSVGTTAQGTAAYNNLSLSENTSIQRVIGTAADDLFIGNNLGNTFLPGLGNDIIQGGTGANTVVMPGPWGAFKASLGTIPALTLQSADGVSGTKTCTGVQTFEFSDARLTLNGSQATLNVYNPGNFDVGLGLGKTLGTAGADTAVFSGNLADYAVTFNRASQTAIVTDGTNDRNGVNTLLNFERLQFADQSINLTAAAIDASIAPASLTRIEELYVAFFNRVPDSDGLAYWVGQFKNGQTINQIAAVFYAAGVQYADLTKFSASMTNTDFINIVYKNVLGRQGGADPGGLDYWNAQLTSGVPRGQLVSTILDAAHTFKGDATYGWVANLLDNKISVAQTVAVSLALNYNKSTDAIKQGMAIAAAVTPTDTSAAIALMGLDLTHISLL